MARSNARSTRWVARNQAGLRAEAAISTVYWYEQLRRYSVPRSVAVFTLLLSSLLGIVTLLLLAACGFAAGSQGFGAGSRCSVSRPRS